MTSEPLNVDTRLDRLQADRVFAASGPHPEKGTSHVRLSYSRAGSHQHDARRWVGSILLGIERGVSTSHGRS